MPGTPTTALRIAYNAGYITSCPGERPHRWETVTRDAQTITRLPDTVAGRGEYNALYRILDAQDVPGYYLVEEQP